MNKGLWRNIAEQVASGTGSNLRRTAVANLAVKEFEDAGKKIVAIQQNPQTGSRWARLAQKGHRVVQFKDVATNKYIAVAVDGNVSEYHSEHRTG